MPFDTIIARLAPFFILTTFLATLPFILIALYSPTPPPSRATVNEQSTDNLPLTNDNETETSCVQLTTPDCPLTCIIVSDPNNCDTCYCESN